MKRFIVCAAIALAACSPPQAPQSANNNAPTTEEASPGEPAEVGDYTFTQAGGEAATCEILLQADAAPDTQGLRTIAPGEDCAETYDVIAAVAGWQEVAGGGIRFVGADGHALGEFHKNADGAFAGQLAGDSKNYLLLPEIPTESGESNPG